jgi:hypothetical protein
MLNNIAHKDLRVNTRYGAEFGDNVGTVMTVPTEFADVQREYPIFFRKDPNTGEFMSIALLGFSKGENLFLDGRGWNASYVPGVIARGPFLIGFQERQEGGETQKEAMIHVDLDSPRISKSAGRRERTVFLPQGGNSRYLDRVVDILNGIPGGPGGEQIHVRGFHRSGPDRAIETRDQDQLGNAVRPARITHHQSAEAREPECRGTAQIASHRIPAGRLPGRELAQQVQRLIELKGRRQRQAATAS